MENGRLDIPVAGGDLQPPNVPPEIAAVAEEPAGPQRRPLPSRRPCETFPIEADGIRYYASVGYYDEARTEPGELFLNTRSKLGSATDMAASDAAVVASIAMQYGVPLAVLRDAVKRSADGTPHGPLGAALDVLAPAEV